MFLTENIHEAIKEKRDMFDIGILTFHDTNNFGAILQAYAMYRVVSEMNYSVEIIDYYCEGIAKREIPIVKLKSQRGVKRLIKWILRDYKEQEKYMNLKGFLKSNTKVSELKYSRKNLEDISNRYKTILVGSDMLWCTDFTNSDYSYMLSGVHGCCKIAYGTSVGVVWKDREEKKIISLLSDFDSLAVREIDTANYLSTKLGRNVWNVCDPTMLIGSSEWERFVINKKKNKCVLVYMDDGKNNCKQTGELYANAYDLDIRISKFQIWPMKTGENVELYSISDFLTEIYGAAMIVTASYHGLLFALYFHVPFIFFNKDSLRMKTLTEKLGIGYRNGNVFDFSQMKSINWDDIDAKVDSFRAESLKVLKRMLLETSHYEILMK